MEKLAIIIPAYRARFLERTLASLAAQTDRRFHVYVGDDASPELVEPLVRKFQEQLPLTYHRFAENLGGQSLTQHWARCIALSAEPWIWLFSDDDVLEPECVAAFYRTVEATDSAFDVYRFDTVFIDENDCPQRLSPPHPEQESWQEFAYHLLSFQRKVTAQEVIFSRAAYERSGGWFELPLAWGSDHASQIIWAGTKGLRRIPGPRVHWRWSGQNISSTREHKLKMIKTRACMKYVTWLLERVEQMPDAHFALPAAVFKPLTRAWFNEHLVHQRQFFWLGESRKIARFMLRTWGGNRLRNWACLLKINCLAAVTLARDAWFGRSK
jgi:glycosyltransferase involved in cell wall biosynthesis